jgi:DNA-binding MarR family transcriptional regulator
MAANGFPEIRPSHSVVFRHIAPAGSRLTELAGTAGLTKQSMAYLVGHLEQHGYVKITTDPADGRARRVQLTRRGNAFVATLLKASLRLENEAGKIMGSAKLQNLRAGGFILKLSLLILDSGETMFCIGLLLLFHGLLGRGFFRCGFFRFCFSRFFSHNVFFYGLHYSGMVSFSGVITSCK